jgi:hypothetical protein
MISLARLQNKTGHNIILQIDDETEGISLPPYDPNKNKKLSSLENSEILRFSQKVCKA